MSSSIYPRRPILRPETWNRKNNPYIKGTTAYYRFKADLYSANVRAWDASSKILLAVAVAGNLFALILWAA